MKEYKKKKHRDEDDRKKNACEQLNNIWESSIAMCVCWGGGGRGEGAEGGKRNS